MLRNLAIVEASCDSPAAAARLRRRLGGKPLVEWAVRRVTECQRIDGVIVLVGPQEQGLIPLVPPDVPVFQGGGDDDPLARFHAALHEYPAEGVVRIRVDSPFVDPTLIDRLVTTAEANPSSDYIGYCLRDGRPTVHSPVGVFAEWVRAAALRTAHRQAVDPLDRRQVTRFVLAHPELFQLRLVPVPQRLDREDLRLTIELEEDWEHVQEIFEALGSEKMDWQGIAGLLDHQPRLRKRMAMLNESAGALPSG